MHQNIYTSKLINIAFAFYAVISIFLPPMFGNLVLHSFALFGFFLFIWKKTRVKKDISLYFALMSLLIFIYLFIFTYINAKSLEEIATLRRLLHYLLAPGLLIFISVFDISLRKLVLLFKSGLVAMFFVLSLEYIFLGNSDYYRPSGLINANQISSIILFLLAFSWVNFFQESKLEKIITLFVIFLGFYTLILSGSRGPIVVAIVLSIIYFFYFYKFHSFKISLKYLFFIITTVLLVSYTPHGQKRVNDTLVEYNSNCLEIDCSPEILENEKKILSLHDKSISLRFYAWKIAIEAAKENIFMGNGFGKSIDVLKQNNASLPYTFDNLHNDYLEVLLSGGLLSLLILLGFVIAPFIFFFQNLSSIKTRPYALLGISASLIILGISFSQESLTYKYISGFYIFFNLLFLKGILEIRKNNSLT